MRLNIQAAVVRSALGLRVSFRMAGELEMVRLPSFSSVRSSGGDLWRHTCFELFVGERDAASYWEWNFSPSGSWNVYRFDDYRAGMKKGHTVPPQIEIEKPERLFSLDCLLPDPFSAHAVVEVGLCCVVEMCDGELSYWAVNHPRPEDRADFHDRGGFSLSLLPT